MLSGELWLRATTPLVREKHQMSLSSCYGDHTYYIYPLYIYSGHALYVLDGAYCITLLKYRVWAKIRLSETAVYNQSMVLMYIIIIYSSIHSTET